MRTVPSLVLIALMVAVAGGPLMAQTAPSTSSAPTPVAVASAVKAIRDASTLAEAASAYSGTAEADRKNVELNTAYMRRLLQLGQPQTAGIPAATLVSIPVNDGMAHGVIGYNAARQNDLPKALSSTMKAAGLLQDDPSIQNNLGQLVAWYEGDKKYKLPSAEQQALDRLTTEMATQAAYMAGYQPIKEAYEKFAEANSEKQQKLTAAEADVAAAQKKVADCQTQIKGLTDEEANDVRLRNALSAQPGGGARAPGVGRGGRGGAGGPGGTPNWQQIQQLNAAIADIDKRLTQAKKDLADAQAALGQKQQARDKIKNAPLSAAPVSKLFYWLPPAVDGAVTLPPGTTSRPTSAPASAAGT